jgi:hypothetical protein
MGVDARDCKVVVEAGHGGNGGSGGGGNGNSTGGDGRGYDWQRGELQDAFMRAHQNRRTDRYSLGAIDIIHTSGIPSEPPYGLPLGHVNRVSTLMVVDAVSGKRLGKTSTIYDSNGTQLKEPSHGWTGTRNGFVDAIFGVVNPKS